MHFRKDFLKKCLFFYKEYGNIGLYPTYIEYPIIKYMIKFICAHYKTLILKYQQIISEMKAIIFYISRLYLLILKFSKIVAFLIYSYILQIYILYIHTLDE